jgi:hypothetical protein
MNSFHVIFQYPLKTLMFRNQLKPTGFIHQRLTPTACLTWQPKPGYCFVAWYCLCHYRCVVRVLLCSKHCQAVRFLLVVPLLLYGQHLRHWTAVPASSWGHCVARVAGVTISLCCVNQQVVPLEKRHKEEDPFQGRSKNLVRSELESFSYQ